VCPVCFDLDKSFRLSKCGRLSVSRNAPSYRGGADRGFPVEPPPEGASDSDKTLVLRRDLWGRRNPRLGCIASCY